MLSAETVTYLGGLKESVSEFQVHIIEENEKIIPTGNEWNLTFETNILSMWKKSKCHYITRWLCNKFSVSTNTKPCAENDQKVTFMLWYDT